MANVTGYVNPEMIITAMSSNLFLRVDPNGTVWAKISRPQNIKETTIGSLYINGVKYTTSSFVFEKIFN